jgi:DNA-binding response OmpR family regulator
MAEDRKRFLDAGVDGYLTKPFSPDQLHAVIASVTSESPSYKIPGPAARAS